MVSFVTSVMRQVNNPEVVVSSGCVYTGGGGSTGALLDGCGRVVRCPGDWMIVIVEWLLVGGVNEILVVRCWVLIQESVTRLSTRIADTAFW